MNELEEFDELTVQPELEDDWNWVSWKKGVQPKPPANWGVSYDAPGEDGLLLYISDQGTFFSEPLDEGRGRHGVPISVLKATIERWERENFPLSKQTAVSDVLREPHEVVEQFNLNYYIGNAVVFLLQDGGETVGYPEWLNVSQREALTLARLCITDELQRLNFEASNEDLARDYADGRDEYLTGFAEELIDKTPKDDLRQIVLALKGLIKAAYQQSREDL